MDRIRLLAEHCYVALDINGGGVGGSFRELLGVCEMEKWVHINGLVLGYAFFLT